MTRIFWSALVSLVLLCGLAAGQDKNVSETKVDSAQICVDKGRELAQANKLDEALACFVHAITLNPQFEEAWRGKGAVLWMMDKQDESLEATAKAIELKPDDFKAWMNKGRAQMRKGDHAEALKTFEQASKLDPGSEDALMGQFAMLRDLKRYDDMRLILNRLIEQKPDEPMRWLRKGMELAEVGQADTALVAFDHLGEMWPDSAWIWIGKGQCLAMMNKYDDAIKALDKATTMNPASFDAWNNKGEVQLKAKRYDDAIASLSRAAGLQSSIPAIPFYNRACAYARKGDKTAALADLKKAIEMMPDLKKQAPTDEDLASLRDDPEFRKLVE